MLQKFVNTLTDLGLNAFAPIVGAVLIFIIGYLIVKLLAKTLEKAFDKSDKLDSSVEKLLVTVVKFGGFFIVLLICAETLNIPTTSLITLLGTFGLAISLSLQSTVANIASGIFIMSTKPFLTGHWISCASGEGTVIQIGLTHTVVMTGGNQKVYIPNSVISDQPVTNCSTEPTRRLDLTIPVSYDTDTAKAKQVIEDVLAQESRLLPDPAPFVRVWNLNSSSVDILVRVWTSRAEYWEIRSSLIENIKIGLDKAGITIPFNTVTVTMAATADKK